MDFYKHIPIWIVRLIETRKCSNCHETAKKEDIEAFGVRPVINGKMSSFYVEHKCQKCLKRTITSFGGQKQSKPVDLAYEIIEHEQNQRRLAKSKKMSSNPVGNINDKEVSELLKFMRQTDNHEDFMNFIGAYSIEKMPNTDKEERGANEG